MIAALNQLVDAVERHLAGDGQDTQLDVAALAGEAGSTEYHLGRMFSSLAGMPLSEYVRRRRMTLAAADLVAGDDDLLTLAVRHGYSSKEAFGRAFRAVHGTSPASVRRDGCPLQTQPRVRFRITVEGPPPWTPASSTPRIPSRGSCRTGAAGPRGGEADLDPDRRKGTELTYLRGVAVAPGTDVPAPAGPCGSTGRVASWPWIPTAT